MSLENILSQVSVLSEQLYRRSYEAYAEGSATTAHIAERAKHIQHEAEALYDNYRAAKKSLSSTKLSEDEIRKTSLVLGNMALSAKNLAEQVNKVMQQVYAGETDPKLPRLDKKREVMPTLETGENFVDYFCRVHDFTGPVIELRNVRGHNVGTDLLAYDQDKEAYMLNLPSGVSKDALPWIAGITGSYLTLTLRALESISATSHFSLKEAEDVKTPKVAVERLKRLRDRYKRPLVTVAASLLIGAGVVGTITYEKISEQQRRISQGESVRNLLIEEGPTETADFAGLMTFHRLLNEEIKRYETVVVDARRFSSQLTWYEGKMEGLLVFADLNDQNDFSGRAAKYGLLVQELSEDISKIKDQKEKGQSRTYDTLAIYSDMIELAENLRELEGRLHSDVLRGTHGYMRLKRATE